MLNVDKNTKTWNVDKTMLNVLKEQLLNGFTTKVENNSEGTLSLSQQPKTAGNKQPDPQKPPKVTQESAKLQMFHLVPLS